MSRPDLNLLTTLDVLLTEGSVARAAARLQLSPSAMSRTLARLRETTGDPLLVRAGRGLVPTPRARELREQVGAVVQAAEALLVPAEAIQPAQLDRMFTLRSAEGFVETFGPRLIERVGREAPRVRLCFLQKPDKDSTPLRNEAVDLETGVVVKTTGPEVRAQALFRDRFIGVVRAGHPLAKDRVTAVRYTRGRHVAVSRQGRAKGIVDDALLAHGLERDSVAIVGGFATAIALARSSDLIATVPERHTEGLRVGMHAFRLPFPMADITVSLLWHPRMDADPGHRWLRGIVRDVCGARLP